MPPSVPGAWDSSPPPTPFDTDTASYIHTNLLRRRSSYISAQHLRIKVGTWNIGNYTDGCARDLAEWFAPPTRTPIFEKHATTAEKTADHEAHYHDIYVLGLQEVVDVNQTQTFLKYMDPKIALNWRAQAQAALPAGYECVAAPQLIGMLMLVFVAPGVAAGSVGVSTVGTGLMGYVGNKGGVGVRLVLGETLRLAFVNVHLAAFANAVDRRNWDAAEVVRRMWFDPVEKAVVGLADEDAATENMTPGEGLGSADVAIWCGDLNYRVDLDNGDIRRLLAPYMPQDLPPTHDIRTGAPTLPPRPSETHPAAATTLDGTLASLLRHDQLLKVRRERKAWAGFREGRIAWLPTYKYDVGTHGRWDSSEKARAPSWCDRILWKLRGAEEEDEERAAKEKEEKEETEKEEPETQTRERSDSTASSIKDETLFEAGSDSDSDDDLVVSRAETPLPHGNNPARKSIDPPPPQFDDPTSVLATPFGQVILTQLSYTSFQTVSSSDHKPVVSTFSLTFPGVVPALRKAVHAEIAREADKLENERRPAVTVVIDPPEFDEGVEETAEKEKEETLVAFGAVSFAASKTRHMTLANTGTTAASICFLPRPSPTSDAEILSKPHLAIDFSDPSITPLTGTTLHPGDSTHVTLTLSVTAPAAVPALNDGTETLDDVLVLHIAGGRDVFLPVTARWLPSAVAAPLQDLLCVPEGAGGFRGWHAAGRSRTQLYSAPRELYRLTGFILERLRSDSGSNSPSPSASNRNSTSTYPSNRNSTSPSDAEDENEEAAIWNSLDTDTPFPAHTSAAAAAGLRVLLTWLSSLPTPLVPTETLDSSDGGEGVLDLLGPVGANVFVYVCGFVGEVVEVVKERGERGGIGNGGVGVRGSIGSIGGMGRGGTGDIGMGIGMGEAELVERVADAVVRPGTEGGTGTGTGVGMGVGAQTKEGRRRAVALVRGFVEM
ncbi:Endonuclease/exonuclease/phosphatase [Geopyxis carbonaria]|nr:Endonuclease/exonuclease/phosphatase [Geopyxis carbonaria]